MKITKVYKLSVGRSVGLIQKIFTAFTLIFSVALFLHKTSSILIRMHSQLFCLASQYKMSKLAGSEPRIHTCIHIRQAKREKRLDLR